MPFRTPRTQAEKYLPSDRFASDAGYDAEAGVPSGTPGAGIGSPDYVPRSVPNPPEGPIPAKVK